MKKCIKGFNSDMTCKGFQYEPDKTYSIPEDELSICNRGFHAIDEDECPLAVFDYYPPSIGGKPSRYFEVEIGGRTEKKDEKICGSEIRVGAEIGILGLVKAHIEWVKRHIKKEGEKHEEEDYSSASNTGNRSSASNTGNRSSASNTGDQSSASNTGDYSSASNTGNRSSASNTGDYSSAEVSGKESVAAVFGKDCKARGALGCWLVLTERGEWNGKTYPIKEVRSVKVDGDAIKPMVWYALRNGEIVETTD